ncbi:MAG TPA: MFS transporter [Capsulimonadaceae bacterium]|nr:MFS transporter [Capsulimonadaceae bacterium]
MESHSTSRLGRIALSACIFLTIAANGFLQPFVPLYQYASHLTKAQIGLIAGVASGSALLVQPFLGALSDRIDARRPFMFAAGLLTCAAYMGYCKAISLPTLLLLTILGANGFSFLTVACGVLAGRAAPNPSLAGRAYAGYRVWGSIGYIIISLTSGLYLALHNTGRGQALSRESLIAIFALGPLVFAGAGLASLFAPDRKRTFDDTTPRPPWWHAGIPRDRNMRMFALAFFLYSFAITGLYTYLGIYMKSRSESPLWITATFTAGVVCEALVMTRIGRLMDHYGRRPTLAIAFLSLPIRLLLYIPATGPLWILCVTTMHGLNFGIMGAASVVFVNDIATDADRGVAQARLAAVLGLASATSPIAGGLLSQVIGMGGMLAVLALVGAAGAVVFITQVHESHPAPVSLLEHCPACLRPVARILSAPP